METRTYHGRSYRLFTGVETRQLDGHGHSPAVTDWWYWEPDDYEGDVLYSNGYADAEEAALAAEDAYDAGDWA